MNAPCLGITVVWSDPDMQEVVVSASNERFSGQINLYAGPDELHGLADLLAGFPSSPLDRRDFLLGQEKLSGYGTAAISVYAKDATGHLIVQVRLHSEPTDSRLHAESCVILVPAVPSDIDRFVQQLRTISARVGSRAVLQTTA